MSAAAILLQARGDGLDLTATTAGTIKVRGPREAVARWSPVILENKAALLAELDAGKEDSASPDFEILDSIRPAMATIPGAILIGASSPYSQTGALFDAHKRYFGKDDAPVLVWQAATRMMNPTVYLDALPLFTAGRARILDSDRLVNQFASLERRTSSAGKDRVDHGPNGHDDVCNSAALALVLASRQVAPLNFHPPTAGPGRSEFLAANFSDANASAEKPGGWPAGSTQAAASGPFAHLGWSPNQK